MVRVRLQDIVEGMEFQSDEMTTYFHRPTGRVLPVSDEAFTAAAEGDEEWVEPEELAEARNILAHQDEFRRFKDAIHRLGLAEQWYAVRDRGYEMVAREWCEAHGIAIDGPVDA